MIFRSKVKNRIAVGVAAAALAIGGVLAGSVPAQAIANNTYDNFPAGCSYGSCVYTSTDGGASGYGTINWDNANGQISFLTYQTDLHSDGHGPVMRAEVCFSDNYTNCVTHDFHVTTGASPQEQQQQWATTSGNYVNDYSTVRIKECNGYSSSGGPLACTPWHGPFHRY